MKDTHKQNNNLQLQADLTGNYLLDRESLDTKAIGLFFAPTGGSVHKVARKIKENITDIPVEMFHITDISAEKLLDYKILILVSSSLGKDAWNNDGTDEWAAFFPALQKLSLNGRKVALVGLGNLVLYPNNFVDGMDSLATLTEKTGGVLIGKTHPEGYAFTMSKAIHDGLFVGLPLDEDNEPEKTKSRIDKWLDNLRSEWQDQI